MKSTDNVLGKLGRISCAVGGRWLRWSARWRRNDEMRNSAAWDERKSSIEALQKDMRGFSDVQVKMGHEIASVVTGLQEATEGRAEVCAHTLGQFSASTQGVCVTPGGCRLRLLGR